MEGIDGLHGGLVALYVMHDSTAQRKSRMRTREMRDAILTHRPIEIGNQACTQSGR
jgi:hypothetical protein